MWSLVGAEAAAAGALEGQHAVARANDSKHFELLVVAAIAPPAIRPIHAPTAHVQDPDGAGASGLGVQSPGLHELEPAREGRLREVAVEPPLDVPGQGPAVLAARGLQDQVPALEHDGGIHGDREPRLVDSLQLHLVPVMQPGIKPWEVEAATYGPWLGGVVHEDPLLADGKADSCKAVGAEEGYHADRWQQQAASAHSAATSLQSRSRPLVLGGHASRGGAATLHGPSCRRAKREAPGP
mmetsp:Transcript_2741/g.8169  ORF Transcript_2741/g.8169 Transcript_2741/m.8169 type:complete len:240 (-) Transcript_2741:10-729(-)